VPADRLAAWSREAGWEVLLNRQGTTWRKLDDPGQRLFRRQVREPRHHPGRRHEEIGGRDPAGQPDLQHRRGRNHGMRGGACEYKLAGSNEWSKSAAGEKFSVPANSSFEIRVAEAYHYICHFG
jgi:hypothetical protein